MNLRRIPYPSNIALWLILSLFATSPGHATPRIDLVQKKYDVWGQNVAAIRENLHKNSPITSGGQRFDAFTGWQISWSLQFSRTANGCSIAEIQTNVTIAQTLPRLISSPSLDLQKMWDNYYSALLRHENGHRDMAIEAATEIETYLKNLPTQPSCRKLESIANRLGNWIIKKFKEKEKSYDRNTRHGMSDGARFP